MEKTRIKFISSWDDGGQLDLYIADILKRYKLPGIFYIPSNHTIGETALLTIAKNFEIGGHTVSHFQDLKKLDDNLLNKEIKNNKIYLERFVAGKKITKFCYPRGRYDERVIGAVKSAGYTSARTTIVLKTQVNDPFREDTTIHVFQRDEYDGKPWAVMAREMVKKVALEGGIFHIWGHSKEIDRDGNWGELDAFFKWLVKNYKIVKYE